MRWRLGIGLALVVVVAVLIAIGEAAPVKHSRDYQDEAAWTGNVSDCRELAQRHHEIARLALDQGYDKGVALERMDAVNDRMGDLGCAQHY